MTRLKLAKVKKFLNVGHVSLSAQKTALVIEIYRKQKAIDAINQGDRMVIHLDAIVKVIARQWDKTSVAVPA